MSFVSVPRKNFACDACGRRVSTEHHLRQHQSHCQQPSTKRYCPYCPKRRFETEAGLKKHLEECRFAKQYSPTSNTARILEEEAITAGPSSSRKRSKSEIMDGNATVIQSTEPAQKIAKTSQHLTGGSNLSSSHSMVDSGVQTDSFEEVVKRFMETMEKEQQKKNHLDNGPSQETDETDEGILGHHQCEVCGKQYSHHKNLLRHKRKTHEVLRFYLFQQAHGGTVLVYRAQNDMGIMEPGLLLEELKDDIVELVQNVKNTLGQVKFQVTVNVEFDLAQDPQEDGTSTKVGHLCHRYLEAIDGVSIANLIDDALATVKSQAVTRATTGSQWVLRGVPSVDIRLCKFSTVKGGCNRFPLPREISKKKATISPDCNGYCLLYCIAAKKTVKNGPRPNNPHRLHHYGAMVRWISDRLGDSYTLFEEASVKLCDKAEQLLEVAINVYGYDEEEKKVLPIRVSEKALEGEEDVVDLLLFKNHFYWISNFNRFMFSKTASHARKWCRRCLNGFRTWEALSKHLDACGKYKPLAAKFPKSLRDILDQNPSGMVRKQARMDTFGFKSNDKMEAVPLMIVADFESLIIPSPAGTTITGKTGIRDRNSMFAIASHQVCSFAYAVVGKNGELHSMESSRGLDSAEKFLHLLLENYQTYINDGRQHHQLMPLSMEEELDFQLATTCHICQIPFDPLEVNNPKVRDHDHSDGKFRGAAHNNCNLNMRQTKAIPVLFHNLRGYDAHFIIRALANVASVVKKIDIIPVNTEKYLSFSLTLSEASTDDPSMKSVPLYAKYIFLDSLQFMPSSLDNLVEILKKSETVDNPKFNVLRQVFGDGSKSELVTKKGHYPYEYMNGFSRFEESRLPARKHFYSSLSMKDISEEDYQHAKLVWSTFNCHSLGDYHDIYLHSDVALLADVIISFRQMCLETYRLDPLHYFSLPGLTLDAALLEMRANPQFEINYGWLTDDERNTLSRMVTNFSDPSTEMELLTDVNQYLFFERGIRGGVSMISKRYAKANNKYLPNFDKSEKSSYIVYLDANNLYGWAMCQYLPVGQFTWLEEEDFDVTLRNILHVKDDCPYGYAFELDLYYPPHLHYLHNDYPLAPETCSFAGQENMSEYQRRLQDENMVPKAVKVNKLIPHFKEKKNYIIHYRNLKLYLRLGVQVTKVHNIILFRQAPILKSYIEKNTERRQASTNDFEKNLYKLLNNALYGKLMENKRKRRQVKLVTSEEEAVNYASKPWFNNVQVLDENLTLFSMDAKHCYLDKPIYVGFTVLELSKLLMYKFHYDVMLPTYGDCPERVQLLFTDTDSLCYQIYTDDLYADFKDQPLMNSWLDTSKYPIDHPLHSNINKLVIGKMKDEMDGKLIAEFVGLKPKMYSLRYYNFTASNSSKFCTDNTQLDGNEKKVAKGVSKAVIKNGLHFEDYKDILFNSLPNFEEISYNTNENEGDMEGDGNNEDETRTKCVLRKEMRNIRSYQHRVFTVHQNKIALTPYDDKRYVCEDGIYTVAYGHKCLENQL